MSLAASRAPATLADLLAIPASERFHDDAVAISVHGLLEGDDEDS